jgi:hypothetical protein
MVMYDDQDVRRAVLIRPAVDLIVSENVIVSPYRKLRH